MLFAWLGTIAFTVLQLVMIRYGAARNIWEITKDELDGYVKVSLPKRKIGDNNIADLGTSPQLFLDIQMVARVAIFFARLSILLLYIRIFFPLGTPKSTFWWVIQAVAWLNFLYTISLILALTLQCVPRHLPWGNSCINQWMVLVNASVINIISDVAVLVIPIASIARLQTTRRKKWAIWALFAFGAIAPLASLARLVYQILWADGPNKTVLYPIVLILATAEQAVAMVVGSAPVASVAVIRLVWPKRPEPAHHKSMSQRMWPAREGRICRPAEDAVRRVPDPFPITDGTTTLAESSEALNLQTSRGQSDDDGGNGDVWEMVVKAKSNTTESSLLEVSGDSYA
ncbi:hypothetical protein F4778DRAFT_749028 [Xylariomycetidae sp. FL2044]|nr:hypothetical protein F4778DRAFT_749028 [Xylariomycetidae sp. FL2044]